MPDYIAGWSVLNAQKHTKNESRYNGAGPVTKEHCSSDLECVCQYWFN
jgi:hypothetical protein